MMKRQKKNRLWLRNYMNIIIQRMISRHDKKSYKKNSNKSTLKSKSSGNGKHEYEWQSQPLIKLNDTILKKKYIDRQLQTQFSETIKRLIQNKNKSMTELRLTCSQKQYMSRLYSNPIAILKLRSNSESRNTGKSGLGAYINTQQRIDKLLALYRKGKNNILNKVSKIQHFNPNLKTQTKILSTGYDDDSQLCLKTLVTKIENMIQSEYNFSTNNILDEMQTYTSKNDYQINPLFDDGSNEKISQISHAKVQFQHSIETTHLDKEQAMKSGKKKIQITKCGATSPVISIKPKIVNEYGMIKYPQRQSQIKGRRTFVKKKNEQHSNSSKKYSKSASCSSKGCSSIKKSKNKKSKKQQPYNQKKHKKKEVYRVKSPK